MSQLYKTNLKIVAAQLNPDFSGTPSDFLKALVERLDILSPVGTNFFVVGDVEPPTNQGPWLKDGRAWYVFDEDEGKYVPADISQSTTSLFVVSETTPEDPTTGDAVIWLRTKGNRVLGWFFWDGAIWRPDGNTPASGTTAQRPSDPGDLEQFWDTSCGCLIHWERGAWRTVSGTPGDVKHVTASLLADALTFNPGWNYLGESNQDYRGKVLGVATRDPGATPASSYSTTSGISDRVSLSISGAESVALADAEIPQHTHLVGKMGSLGSGKYFFFYRVDTGDALTAPGSGPPNYADTNGSGIGTSHTGNLPPASAGCAFVTSTQLSEAVVPGLTDTSTAHNNVQPTIFLWTLVKT